MTKKVCRKFTLCQCIPNSMDVQRISVHHYVKLFQYEMSRRELHSYMMGLVDGMNLAVPEGGAMYCYAEYIHDTDATLPHKQIL